MIYCKSNVITNVQSYHWRRTDQPLPDNVLVKGNSLTIKSLNENSAAVYVCVVRNQTHRVEIHSVLRVTNIIPQFSGKSFIALKHLSALNSNEIEISFKVANLSTNSLILFSGSTKRQDFLALLICNQHLEARFDLGNGVISLKSHSPLQENIWHRVRFKRQNLRALLEVDDQPEVEHVSFNEKSVGLNLDDYLYVGGYTNLTHLQVNRKLMLANGLHGCVSALKMDGKRYSLMKSAFNRNVANCDTCNVREQKLRMYQQLIENKKELFTSSKYINQHIHHLNEQLSNVSSMIHLPDSLCKNGGICQEALTPQGTRCICPSGWAGEFCERISDSACLPDSCGLGGRCLDLKSPNPAHQHLSINKFIKKNNQQFLCDCPLGREGDRCQQNISISVPRFTGRSFLIYPIPRDSSAQITILVKLKLTVYQPDNVIRDGLILYAAEKSNGVGDFISLVLKDQRLEFQFNTGSGVTTVQSDLLSSLFNSTWLTVRLVRDGGEARMQIFDKEYVGYSPGTTKGINLRSALYLGGVDDQLTKLPVSLNDSIGFVGCVNRLEINNQTIDLLSQAIDSSNIKECKVQSACSKNPCKNHGLCTELSTDAYRCTCKVPFSGTNCEKNNGICALSKPCHNRGKCLDSSSSLNFADQSNYKCCCLYGFSGRSCDIIEAVKDKRWANFDNTQSSYLTIDLASGNSSSKTEQVIELTFKTERFNGLLFYQGWGEMDFVQRDYLIINLNDGYLEVEWQLGERFQFETFKL